MRSASSVIRMKITACAGGGLPAGAPCRTLFPERTYGNGRGTLTVENKIGEFLISIDAMKQFQVDDVLRVQKNGDKRMFGEIAIELGYINDAALQKYIEYKHMKME
jgi:hypothetical protein